MRNRTHDRKNIPIDESTLDVCRGLNPCIRTLDQITRRGSGGMCPPAEPPSGGLNLPNLKNLTTKYTNILDNAV